MRKADIATSTMDHIVRAIAIAALEEQGLTTEIRENTTLDATAKVLSYCDRTSVGLSREPLDPELIRVTVKSEYVRQCLGLAPHAMKAARDKLEEIGEIIVDRPSHGGMVIRHLKPF